MLARLAWYRVRENGVEINKMSNGAYFIADVEPGTHTFTAESEIVNKLTLEIDPGETYFVKGEFSMGLVINHPNLIPSDQATFDGAFAKKHLHLEAPPVVKATDVK